MLLHQKKNHYLRIGLAITAVITAMALVGCFWTPYAPTAMSGSEKFAAPSLRHLFGTDNFGRDIFSRVTRAEGSEIIEMLKRILRSEQNKLKRSDKHGTCNAGKEEPP